MASFVAEEAIFAKSPDKALADATKACADAKKGKDESKEAFALAAAADAGIRADNLSDALAKAEDSLKAAKSSKQKPAEGRALLALALVKVASGQPFEAIDPAEQALALVREAGEREGEAAALQGVARACAACGDTVKAVESAKASVALFKAAGSKVGLMLARASLAVAHEAAGEPADAVTVTADAVQVMKELGDKKGEADATLVLGAARLVKEGPERALKAATAALDLFKALGQKRGQSLALSLISRVQLEGKKDAAEAASAASEALSLAKGAKDGVAELQAVRAAVAAQLAKKDAAEAAKVAAESAASFGKSKDKRFEAAALQASVAAYLAKSDKNEALKAARGSLKLYQELKDATGEMAALQAEISVHDASKDYDAALKAAEDFRSAAAGRGDKKEAAGAMLAAAGVLSAKSGPDAGVAKAEETIALCKENGDLRGQGQGLSAVVKMRIEKKDTEGAVEAAKQLVDLYQGSGDKRGLANAYHVSALAAQANCRLKTSWDFGVKAIQVIFQLGDRVAELPILETMLKVALAREDPDESNAVAMELLKIYKQFGNKAGAASSMTTLAMAYHAFRSYKLSVKTAQDAEALYEEVGDYEGQMKALRVMANAYDDDGRYSKAAAAARKHIEVAKKAGNKRLEAEGLYLVAYADFSLPEALEAAVQGVALARSIPDAHTEAMNLQAHAWALMKSKTKPNTAEALKVAKEACAVAKTLPGDFERHTYGLCLNCLARAQFAREQFDDAKKSAQQAVDVFAQGKKVGHEDLAEATLNEIETAITPKRRAKLHVDQWHTAHIEVSELCDQDSLMAVINVLHSQVIRDKVIKVIVLHVDGIVAPQGSHCKAINEGTFMVGLRTSSIPILAAISGTIAGPSWQFVLGVDYRIVATNTMFVTPVWGPPENMSELMQHCPTIELMMHGGTIPAPTLLELGILQECRLGRDESKRAADEMARRMSAYPWKGSRQTMALLNPNASTYVRMLGQNKEVLD